MNTSGDHGPPRELGGLALQVRRGKTSVDLVYNVWAWALNIHPRTTISTPGRNTREVITVYLDKKTIHEEPKIVLRGQVVKSRLDFRTHTTGNIYTKYYKSFGILATKATAFART